MVSDASYEAELQSFLRESEIGEESIRLSLANVAKILVSSDILLYNTINHYQFQERIINRYDPKSPPAGYPSGDIELGPFLYWLENNQPPADWARQYQLLWYGLQAAIRLLVGGSTISQTFYADLLLYVKTSGISANDGTLIGLEMYQQLDVHWLEAVIHYLYYKAFPKEKTDFNNSPANPIPLRGANPGEVKIAIIGDWGTGRYDPAKTHDKQDGHVGGPASAVMAAVSVLAPDYIIHLGNVYYACTDKNASIGANAEQNNFLRLWSSTITKNFTLNSNHEMYGGANGCFKVALASEIFASQGKQSFFALEYGDWAILGLDSAYYCDNDDLYMNGRIIDNTQVQLLKAYQSKKKNAVLMTHHNAMTYDGSSKTMLWSDVTSTEALAGAPAYWYWGHLHEGVVYSNKSAVGADGHTRCVGHSAVPNGEAWGLLDKKGNNIPAVDYFVHTPVDPTGEKSARVFNGFAIITLTHTTLKEQFYELDNASRAVLKWPQ